MKIINLIIQLYHSLILLNFKLFKFTDYITLLIELLMFLIKFIQNA